MTPAAYRARYARPYARQTSRSPDVWLNAKYSYLRAEAVKKLGQAPHKRLNLQRKL